MLLAVLLLSFLRAVADTTDDFFRNGPIPHVRIQITGTNLSALQRENRKYVRCTVREGDKVYENVAVHLKGAAGSFRGLDDRPALTLNFDKFHDGQDFHGLKKLHLNNSVQDPSYMTELICGELFVAAGVPATRATHAHVELNGRDLGFYVLKEGFDKAFLRRFFKNPNGNLYDGGFLREVTDDLELDSGDDVKDHSDLKALAKAAQEPDASKRMAALSKVLDIDRFITFMALEIMIWDWDGYPMKHNNYRVYHNLDTGKMVFFPHGMDQMFWEPNGPILPDNMEGLVARAVITTPEGRRMYRERMGALLTNVFKVNVITNRIDEVHARIRPVLAAISKSAARNHDSLVANLKSSIAQRASSIETQLSMPEPKPLAFDSSGKARVSGWRADVNSQAAELNKGSSEDVAEVLRIHATGSAIASWRSKVMLDPGRYRFEARARTKGVAGIKDMKGEGAGIRKSGSQEPRKNHLSGDSPWTDLKYEFSVAGTQEVVLVCELRANKGEVWFDENSLALVKLP